jgi:hypothetical protein
MKDVPKAIEAVWKIESTQAVVITQDSVSGIPYEMSLCGDSCRRTLPRTQVDSVKLGYLGHHIDSKVVLEGAGVITLLLLAEAAVCAIIGATHDC